MPAIDIDLVHAREFTNIEVEGLTLWNLLQDQDEPDLARELLDAILMHEHYTSELPANQAARTPQQLVNKAKLSNMADALLQKGREALSEKGVASPAKAPAHLIGAEGHLDELPNPPPSQL